MLHEGKKDEKNIRPLFAYTHILHYIYGSMDDYIRRVWR